MYSTGYSLLLHCLTLESSTLYTHTLPICTLQTPLYMSGVKGKWMENHDRIVNSIEIRSFLRSRGISYCIFMEKDAENAVFI